MLNIGMTLSCLTAISAANAKVTVPPIFADHAVLQKSKQTPVWGRASPGETVTVTLGAATGNTHADAAGRWRVDLDLEPLGAGPFDLIVQAQNRLVIRDVLVGEVWLCSGQSNMEFVLRNSAGASAEIARSDNPMLRQFSVSYKASLDPQDSAQGYWSSSSPASSGGFTAIGYYFGQMLQKRLGVPVAIISSSWGGTPIETWISSEALDRDPELGALKDKLTAQTRANPERIAAFASRYHSWANNYGRQDSPGPNPEQFAAPDADLSGWKPVHIPGRVAVVGLPDSGAIWLRREINVTESEAGASLYMPLGLPSEGDTVFWNGEKIAATSIESGGAANPRIYNVPARLVREGKATLAIRLFAPAGGAGIVDGHSSFRAGSFPLSGEWLAKVERALPEISAEALAARPAPVAPLPALQEIPTTCFNGKIDPLIPYALRGVLWYQGESNVGNAAQYRTAFPILINDWRTRWGRGNLPFYFCQLPNFEPIQAVPAESARAELREAQAAALSLPNTGMATLIDVGETGSIHPRDKRTPGERLAQIALVNTYGRPGVAAGPTFASLSIEGARARIHFSSLGGGLEAKPVPAAYRVASLDSDAIPLPRHSPESQLEGFAICGSDRHWHWANAKIDGETVVVWSDAVPSPVDVRYAWANSPIVNLYNVAGLPAAPFRTDGPHAVPIKQVGTHKGEPTL